MSETHPPVLSTRPRRAATLVLIAPTISIPRRERVSHRITSHRYLHHRTFHSAIHQHRTIRTAFHSLSPPPTIPSPTLKMLLPSPSLLPLLLLSLALPTLAQQDSNSSATSAEYTSDSSFRDAVLDVTNTYRKQHNATGLSWNETLAEFAADWAGECGFVHSVSVVF